MLGKGGCRSPISSRRTGGGGIHPFKALPRQWPQRRPKSSRWEPSRRSNAPGGSSGSTPRGRCRLAATVEDQLPPLQPVSRTAPQCPGPGRKRVHPGPHHPGAADLKRREPLPARPTAQETSETLTPRCARGRGGARAPGWGDRRGRAGWLGGRGPGEVGTGAGPETWRAGGWGLVFATAKGLWVYYKAELGGRGAGGIGAESEGIQS